MSADTSDDLALAIVGLAGRWPGAADVATFWDNLAQGRCHIRRYDEQELLAAGVDRRTLRDPAFVPAGAELPGVELFDAAFFDIGAREAASIDPQHRLFLECAYEALEDAACDPRRFDGAVGVYAAPGAHHYLWKRFFAGQATPMDEHLLQITLGHSLPTRVSYKLDLRGPSLAVQTGCSASLVAVHLACQALLSFECDLALAGGVSIMAFQKGYFRQDGALSAEGLCRAFDADADGLVAGNGVGVVALKRLADARAARDHVYAVVRGSAINNDGVERAGFVVPSVQGQTRVVTTAQTVAGISADSIGYIEAHGTGTPLGDSIELTALERVFQAASTRRGFCAVGSVKANVGHLDAASGVVGLIKATLAVYHGAIPPQINVRHLNTGVNWERSPFYLARTLTPWHDAPRRAAISSFGIGGTNAHAIVEQAPETPAGRPGREAQVLVLAARTRSALDAQAQRLAQRLEADTTLVLADVAHTLQVGRTHWPERRVVVAAERADAVRALRAEPLAGTLDTAAPGERTLAFIFPGAGGTAGVGAGLYRSEAAFREAYDACARAFVSALGYDPRASFAPGAPTADATTLASLFACEYALARLWQSLGLQPAAYAGHSLGEYVAATLAGVFTLEGAVQLVAARVRLFEGLPVGAMLSVPLPESDVLPLLGDGVGLAAVNGPERCVVSGPVPAIEALARSLQARRVGCTRLPVQRAGHSSMLDAHLAEFEDAVRAVPRQAPCLPFISNLSGTWITPEQACDPAYWSAHLRQPVRWASGLATLLADDGRVLLEVGPDQSLTQLVRKQLRVPATQRVVASLGRPDDLAEPVRVQLALGRLWLAGVAPDWSALHAGTQPRRVPLPSYPFERQRYWSGPHAPGAWPAPLGRHAAGARAIRPGARYLVASDDPAATDALATALDRLGARAVPLTHLRPLTPRLHDLTDFVTQREQALDMELAIRGVDAYPGLRADLLRVCRASALEYLRPAFEAAPASTLEDLYARLGVRPGFRPFCDYLVSLLEREGLVTRAGTVWRTQNWPAPQAPDALAREAAQRHPGFARVFALVAHCAAHYPRVFTGALEANSVLYPEGRYDLLEDLARHTVETSQERRYRRLLAQTLAQLAERAGRPLRVLEVGGGTGLLTREIFEAVPAERLRYTFSDIGRGFVQAARRLVSEGQWPALATTVLDVARDPRGQGLAASSFDVIVALNVVQATRDVAGALGHLRGLLAPGGLLALLQSLHDEPWMHLVFGLSPGWWNFVDDPCRGTSPVLPLERWETLATQAGCEQVFSFPRGPERTQAEFGLVLASVPPAGERLDLPGTEATTGFEGLLVWDPAVRPDPERLAALERLASGRDIDCAVLVGDGGPALPSTIDQRCALTHRLGIAGLRLDWTALHLPHPARASAAPDVVELADFLGQTPAEPGDPLLLIATPAAAVVSLEGAPAGAASPAGNATEQHVARLFAELLGKADARPDDDFFECGGDSLLALQLVARLRDVFRVVLPVRELFESSSVASLAALIERQRGQSTLPTELAIPVRPRGADDIEAALAQIETLDEEALRQLVVESE